MTAEDVEAVVKLERASYAFPWTPLVFSDCLRMGYYGFLLETEDGLLHSGFLLADGATVALLESLGTAA